MAKRTACLGRLRRSPDHSQSALRNIRFGAFSHGLGRTLRFDRGSAKDRNRRLSPVASRFGEGRLTEPKAAARPWRPELVFMCRVSDAGPSRPRLAIHHYSVVDCTTAAAMQGTHYRLTTEHEWDDPACSIGPCGNAQSAQEIGLDSIHAAQSDSGDATPVYSGSSTPISGSAGSGDENERLC